MASFYGNIKNNSRASFIFDRIYSSRVEMETALKIVQDDNGEVQGDGVFINRYVLIDYGYTKEGQYVAVNPAEVNEGNVQNYYVEIEGEYQHPTSPITINNETIYYQKVNFVDRFTYGQLENTYYKANRQMDENAYHADYDLTVWMKIYSDNEEKYIMVARLAVDPPAMELIIDAPADKNGGAHFDLLQSSDKNYVYHVPNTWQVYLNEYKPEDESTYTLDNDVDGYWRYEYDNDEPDERTYNYEHEYPFYNEAGFDPYIQTTSDEEDEIIFNDTKSGRRYLEHAYQKIDLTPESYRRNQYYIKINDEYILSTEEFTVGAEYYIKTQAVQGLNKYQEIELDVNTYRDNYYYLPIVQNSNIVGYELATGLFDDSLTYYTNIAEVEQIDTKRLDISLPSIGNAVSAMYDSIYGQPNAASGYLLGYTDPTTAADTEQYKETENENYNIPVDVQYDPEDTESKALRYVSQDEINNLYHDNTNPHTIPVYDTTGTRRPYTQDQLFDAINIDPYDNINPSDPVSMAWSVYEIKKYLSELRFLAAGEGVIGYTNNTEIQGYTQNENSGLYLIDGHYYNLTEEQIEDLQPYSEQYPIPVRKTRGIQADWGLDDINSFGYIYHKPRILWSWDEEDYTSSGEEEMSIDPPFPIKEDTDHYAQNSIEFIYDHYDDENITDEDLFGPARNGDTWLTAKV